MVQPAMRLQFSGSNQPGSPAQAPGVVGTDDPLVNIVVLLLVIPTLTVSGALLAALLARWKGQQFSWPKYLNVVGVMVGKGLPFVAVVLSVASQKVSIFFLTSKCFADHFFFLCKESVFFISLNGSP